MGHTLCHSHHFVDRTYMFATRANSFDFKHWPILWDFVMERRRATLCASVGKPHFWSQPIWQHICASWACVRVPRPDRPHIKVWWSSVDLFDEVCPMQNIVLINGSGSYFYLYEKEWQCLRFFKNSSIIILSYPGFRCFCFKIDFPAARRARLLSHRILRGIVLLEPSHKFVNAIFDGCWGQVSQ